MKKIYHNIISIFKSFKYFSMWINIVSPHLLLLWYQNIELICYCLLSNCFTFSVKFSPTLYNYWRSSNWLISHDSHGSKPDRKHGQYYSTILPSLVHPSLKLTKCIANIQTDRHTDFFYIYKTFCIGTRR